GHTAAGGATPASGLAAFSRLIPDAGLVASFRFTRGARLVPGAPLTVLSSGPFGLGARLLTGLGGRFR
ncbi:MAG: hypothetical protein WBG64_20645, partial [Thermoanaerobaculia bacterium]